MSKSITLRHRLPALRAILSYISLFSVLMPNAALAFSCSVTATAVAFGTYNPLNVLPTTAVGNVHISCNSTLADLLDLIISTETSLSQGNSGSYAPRTMTNGAASLEYNLYTEPTFNTIWGDGSSGTSTVSATDLVLPLLGTVTADHLVHGRIPASQNVGSGDYSDTITVTVTF